MVKPKRYETISIQRDYGVEWISLNRPHRLNAFNMDMIEELSTALDEAEADEEVRCIVFQGAGDRAFSAGADLMMFTDLDQDSAVDASEKGQRLMSKVEASKPSIAAIHGFCLGGGLELALACDFRIAAESAILGNPEINLGIIPGWGGTQRLCRIIGLAKAKELVFLGNRLNADEAINMGLVHKVVPFPELHNMVANLARRLTDGPPVAIKLAKNAMNDGSQLPLSEGLKIESQAFGVLATTEDVIEGISAFFEKRKPEFKGK
jgi:enoyl-CoA hydratase/3-hydroxyacyl-CoA dehydrogenase